MNSSLHAKRNSATCTRPRGWSVLTPITVAGVMLIYIFIRSLFVNVNVNIKKKGFYVCSTYSLTAALDQLRFVVSSTSSDLGLRSGQHQQTGQCLLPLVAVIFFVDDPADASSQRREECQCGLLLTVAVPAKQVCSPVGDGLRMQ